jgi:hypothetical protein
VTESFKTPACNSGGESCTSTIIYQRNTALQSSRVSKLLSIVWGLLHAHVPRANEEANQELAIALSQTLAALVTDGVTDPKQLRRRGLESMALTLR